MINRANLYWVRSTLWSSSFTLQVSKGEESRWKTVCSNYLWSSIFKLQALLETSIKIHHCSTLIGCTVRLKAELFNTPQQSNSISLTKLVCSEVSCTGLLKLTSFLLSLNKKHQIFNANLCSTLHRMAQNTLSDCNSGKTVSCFFPQGNLNKLYWKKKSFHAFCNFSSYFLWPISPSTVLKWLWIICQFSFAL